MEQMKSTAEKKDVGGVTDKMNGKQMFVKERLPPKHKELQVYTNDKNLVTRTQNCQVHFLIEINDIRKSIDVNSPRRTDDNITIAVQKKEKQIAKGCPKGCRYPIISHNGTGD